MTDFDQESYELWLTIFRGNLHPRDSQGRFRIKGFHGLTGSKPLSGDWHHNEIYIGIDSIDPEYHGRGLASAYAEGGVLYEVDYPSDNPLILNTGEKIKQAWDMSGALNQDRYSDSSRAFADWARAQGYDAVVADWHPDDEAGYEWGAGTFGEPQAILLNPAKAKLTRVQ